MAKEENKVTLSDLSNGAKHVASIPPPLPRLNAKNVKEVNVLEVAQKAPEPTQEEVLPSVIKSTIEKIPETIARLNNESLAIVEAGKEQRMQQMIDSDDIADIDADFPSSTPEVNNTNNRIVRQTFNDSDLDELDSIDIDDDDDGIDFPINNTRYTERNVTMNENKSTTDINERIKNISDSVDETPSKIEFPEPTDEDKEKLAEKVKETYEAVTGETIVEAVAEEATIPEKINESESKSEETPAINAESFHMSDDDLALLDDDDLIVEKSDKEKEEEEKKRYEEIKSNLRDNIKSNFKSVNNKIDVSTFTVKKKAISASKVLNHIKEAPIHTATNVLYNTTKKVIEVSEFSATEIQKLNPALLNQGNFYTAMRDRYQMLYKHIVDPNKPKTFEAWLKTVPEDAIDDYFFAAYKATFGNANTITYECDGEDGCQNIFMQEMPIMSMIKFKNDEVKNDYMNILHTGDLNTAGDTYSVGRVQISDEYVFDLKTPTLYERVFEPTLLDSNILETFSDLITLISYIDAIYVIDAANRELIPVNFEPAPGDPRKTVRRKIKICASIIRSLTSDQLQTLTVETDKYDKPDSKKNKKEDDDETPDIQYVFPECECKKCKKKIPERVIDPTNMLFTRHQLGLYQRI